MDTNDNIKDLIIVGAGPAGLSAAVYAARAGLSLSIYNNNFVPGGQVLQTYEVDNYLGMPGVNGFDMGVKFNEHAQKFGINAINEDVEKIEKNGDVFNVHIKSGVQKAKAVLVCTGADYRKLGVKGEEEFIGKGVSYCATCDGAFFKQKTTAVIGGSYTAVEDAIYLSALCEKVYLVHRRDKLRAGAFLEKKLFDCKNVEVVWNSTVVQINGEGSVKGITTLNKITNEQKDIKADGVFVAVGTVPQNKLLQTLAELDDYGYAIADESCKTSVKGLFVAGDLRKKSLRQIATAVSDGANAATSIYSYLTGE